MKVLKPLIQVKTKNNKDISKAIISLTLNDYFKQNIPSIRLRLSQLELNFNDCISLYLGYDKLIYIGDFYINKIVENYLLNYEVEGISFDYQRGLKLKKNRSFNLSYKEVLSQIANENSLILKCKFKRENEITYIEQNALSDTSLLNSLAKELECYFSIKNNRLFFYDKDFKPTLKYKLKLDEVSSLSIEYNNLNAYKSIIATYIQNNTNQTLKIGNGEPVLLKNYTLLGEKTQSEIVSRAQSALKKAQNTSIKGRLSKIGEVMFAGGELEIKLKNKTHEVIIQKITHNISPSGWLMDIEF